MVRPSKMLSVAAVVRMRPYSYALPAWRRDHPRYLWRQGNGDPHRLARRPLGHGRRTQSQRARGTQVRRRSGFPHSARWHGPADESHRRAVQQHRPQSLSRCLWLLARPGRAIRAWSSQWIGVTVINISYGCRAEQVQIRRCAYKRGARHQTEPLLNCENKRQSVPRILGQCTYSECAVFPARRWCLAARPLRPLGKLTGSRCSTG
jgi:hypothetical protein